jgi:hypothetical protein
MILIENFGWRLGNQMFQIATACSVAEKSGTEVSFPKWKYEDIFDGDFTPKESEPVSILYRETGFHYTEITPNKSMSLEGYFQSEKYFKNIDSKIRKMFNIKKSIKDIIYEKHKNLLDRENVVALHLRRGDYINFPNHHPIMDLDYFMRAVENFPTDSTFLVFSDDVEWCKNNFPRIGETFFIIEGQSDVEDFTMMTMCDHNCISNSTFSWWAAWLNDNPDKIVVAPDNWFGIAYSNFNKDDLYCEGWIRI